MTTQQDLYDLLRNIESLVQSLLSRQISPKQIVTIQGLSDIDENLGLIQAGEFRSGNQKEPGDSFSGTRIAYPGMTYDSATWNIVGVDGDTMQWGARSSDGVLVAGGGAVVLSSTGISAEAGDIGGWTISSDAISKGAIKLSSATPAITFNDTDVILDSNGITAVAGTIAGWTLSETELSNGAVKINSAAPSITLNDTDVILDSDGIAAVAGTIGGWTLGETTLSATNIELSAAGQVTVGTDSDVAVLSSADTTYRLWIGDSDPANAPFRVTKAGHVDLEDATIALTLQSDSYSAGVEGWYLDPAGNAEFQNITARGSINASVFSKNTISANGGTLGIFNSAGKLLNDVTTTSDSDGFDVDVEDGPDGHVQTFVVGDILRMKDGTGDNWMTVSTVTDNTTHYTYNCLLSNGSATTFRAGTAIADYGQSGDGFLYMTADEAHAPYYSVRTHAGSPWSTVTEVARLGNLNGFLSYITDLYGLGMGEATKYLSYDPTNGLRLRGVFTFAGGLGTIDDDAISINTLNYVIRQTATNNSLTRIGKLGMSVNTADSASAPAFELSFVDDVSGGGELVSNGDFEDGDSTGWGADSNWTVCSTTTYGGSAYSIRCDANLINSDSSAVITSDRMDATAGNTYTVSLRVKEDAEDVDNLRCDVLETDGMKDIAIDSTYETQTAYSVYSGPWDDLCIGNWTAGGYNTIYRSYIKFDLSAISSDATIDDAYVYIRTLSGASANTSTDVNIEFYRLLKPIQENFMSWIKYNSSDVWGTPGGYGDSDSVDTVVIGMIATSYPLSDNTWYSGALTSSDIKDFVDGTLSNNGLFLKGDSESAGGFFWGYSRYANDGDSTTISPSAPYMTVSYHRYSNLSVDVNWYDDSSAGSLIRTDNMATEINDDGWRLCEQTLTAPTGAKSVEVKATGYTGQPFYLDDVSVIEASVNTIVQLNDSSVDVTGNLNVSGSLTVNSNAVAMSSDATAAPSYPYYWSASPVDADSQPTGFTWGANTSQYEGGFWYTSNDGIVYNYHPFVESGTYQVRLVGTSNTSCGKVDVSIDSAVVGTIDQYGSLVYNKVYTIDSVAITGDGNHTLSLTVNGKNVASGGYYMTLNSIQLLKTA